MNWKDMIGTTIGGWDILERDYHPTSKQHSTFFKCRCRLCGEIYSVSRDTLVSKNPNNKKIGCQKCSIKKTLQKQGKHLLEDRYPIGTKSGKLTIISKPYHREDRYKNSKYFKCKCDCGNEAEVRADHFQGRYKKGIWEQTMSCGKCNNISNGELKIKEILDATGIKYVYQYKIEEFDKLKSFDFALFNDKDELIKLIEYDGEQHFKPVDIWGGEEHFQIQQQRDALKNEYCNTHGIFLQRIPYYDFKKLSPEYLGITDL